MTSSRVCFSPPVQRQQQQQYHPSGLCGCSGLSAESPFQRAIRLQIHREYFIILKRVIVKRLEMNGDSVDARRQDDTTE